MRVAGKEWMAARIAGFNEIYRANISGESGLIGELDLGQRTKKNRAQGPVSRDELMLKHRGD